VLLINDTVCFINIPFNLFDSAIHCPPLVDRHATLNTTENVYGSVVSIKCNPGYQVFDSFYLITSCTIAGIWSVKNATCKRKSETTYTIKEQRFLQRSIEKRLVRGNQCGAGVERKTMIW